MPQLNKLAKDLSPGDQMVRSGHDLGRLVTVLAIEDTEKVIRKPVVRITVEFANGKQEQLTYSPHSPVIIVTSEGDTP